MQTPNAGEFSVLQRFLDHRTTTTANTSTAETLVTVRGDEKRVFSLLGGKGAQSRGLPPVPAFQPAVPFTFGEYSRLQQNLRGALPTRSRIPDLRFKCHSHRRHHAKHP